MVCGALYTDGQDLYEVVDYDDLSVIIIDGDANKSTIPRTVFEWEFDTIHDYE